MDLMPAILLVSFPVVGGYGGIAVNVDGTLFASVDGGMHCVYIYSLADRTADPVVVGTLGSAHGQLCSPRFACFVRRDGRDTLLICDGGNDRIVEVTADGAFLRAIALPESSRPWGVAYCSNSDVIAVSLWNAHMAVLLQYESGAVKPEATIGSGTAGTADGQLFHPCGVKFTTDGDCVLVADWRNDRVSKFSVISGDFIAHVATHAHGIFGPSDVLECEDGSILVAQWCNGGLVRVGKDGVVVPNIIMISSGGGIYSLSYSPFLHGVVVKTLKGGNLFLLRDAWMHSSRGAWLSAITTP